MEASQVLDALKESKEDAPLVRCFKRYVGATEDCGRELERAYNSVLPQNTARGVVFAALAGASTALAELGKTTKIECDDDDGSGDDDEDLEEETLRELPWGRRAAGSFLVLRVAAAAEGAAVLQDAEGSVVLGAGAWPAGALLLWRRPLLRLAPDRRLRLAGSGTVIGAAEQSDVRYARHPFVRGGCDACGRGEGRGLLCGRCRVAHYCSLECQKKAWPGHRQVCAPGK